MTSEILTRAATFEPSSFDEAQGTVIAVISAGADVPRRDLTGPYVERLKMTPEAWSTARPTVPVLKDHQRNVDSVIGRAENIRVENGRALATIRLSDRPDLAGIRRDIQTGILDSLSFGYVVPRWREYSENGTRVREAEQVVVHEVSFVPIGADPQATTRGEVTMEQQQQEQIRSIATAVGVPAAFAEDLIQRNVSVDDARAAIIREAAKSTPVIDARQPAIVTRDHADGLIERMADGLATRVIPGHKPEAGRQYVYHRLADFAREILRERGLSTLGSPVELLSRAMHTTSDFAVLLQETFNKALFPLRTAPSPITQIFRRTTMADFRKRHILEVSDGPALEEVAESGEIRFGTIEGRELASYRLASYAKGFAVSFRTLVDDDIGALSDISEKIARGARQWFTSFLIDTIIANPKLADGKAVFHADHANLAASGAAPSDLTIAAARLAIRKQTDLSGNPIGATPRFILIPAALETTVDKLLATLYPTSSTEAETAARGLTPLVEPRLDAKNQTTAWYLFCPPAEAPIFEFAELSGVEGPRVESRPGWNTLGTEFRVVWHLGCGAVDHRGAFKNPGA